MKMKFLILLSTIIFSTFISSCVQTNAVSSRQLNESTPSRVMLEIDYLSYDSMGATNGRTLEFRLLENGKFEYEEYSYEKARELGTQAFASEAISKKEGTLNETELAEVREILTSKELEKVDNQFKNAEGFCTCGATRSEIRYKKDRVIKNIVIDGSSCTDLTNPSEKMFPKFPKILSQLIKKVQKIKYPNAENS